MINLKKIRESQNKTQQNLADFLGVSRPTYTRYENGEREPDFLTLKKLSEYFDVSIDYLLGIEKAATENAEAATEYNRATIEFNAIFNQLSPEGRAELIRHAELLLKLRDLK